ncbi:hypothetical protein HNQ71_001482 [Mesorhizobium sangaii]|uniref:Uncharacterized protein n=1 Tax=Mesorhizobium sangaii TaxID=505389 RepID=A0A841P7M4_9HYPH|nr:hypothetical protein [Mesorhizobium sangaii]
MKLVRMILRLIYDGMSVRASPTRPSEPRPPQMDAVGRLETTGVSR